ncbi:DUF3313 domain-containing protein [Rhodopseudomonas boonkerdii]|uniref:DUF3313 domain-containing protein n=1 Tax=Rhodopseudomonas boonkerdii TaxID=475937 RepID=UPI0032217CD2
MMVQGSLSRQFIEGTTVRWIGVAALALLTAGCAAAPLEMSGALRDYTNLTPSNGTVTKSLLRVSKDEVLAARTVKIAETRFAPRAYRGFKDDERSLVANAINRELCDRLAERFTIVAPAEPADLTVQAVVTHATPTDVTAAGASRVAQLAKTIALPGVPVPVPRLPVGLGSLSVEAEAIGPEGAQKAAMVWARGASSLTQARMSNEGDAYDLAAEFGADFAKLLVTGATPFGGVPQLPTIETIRTRMGGAPKYTACESYGRFPGLAGVVGGGLGLPPNMADKGAPTQPSSVAEASR